jgi:ABC-type nitrate/sulfonate/bicarbonate transport system substrate-binding protein
VIKAIEQGAPLGIVGEVNKTAIGWGLVVPPDSPIKTIDDLEPGMKISYTSEGALTQWYALYVADQAGIDPTEIEGVPIGTNLPTIATALEEGQIDAAAVLLPWGDVLESEGTARWVAHMDKQLPKFSFTGIPATDTAIEDEQTTSCLLGAYSAAVRWMAQNPDETQRFFEDFYQVEPALAKTAYEQLLRDFNETAQMEPDRMQFVIDELQQVPGFIGGSATVEDVLQQAEPASEQDCAAA